MIDPSGLRVIEALCPSVSRYQAACPGARRVSCLSEAEQSALIEDHIRDSMKRAVSEMRTYDPGHYHDRTGTHRT
jgi:hypothetical protein